MVHFNMEYINIVLFQFSVVNFNMPAQHGDFHALPQHDVLDNMFFLFCQQDQQDLLLHAWVQHFVEQHLVWRADVNMQVDNIDFICLFCPIAVSFSVSTSGQHCRDLNEIPFEKANNDLCQPRDWLNTGRTTMLCITVWPNRSQTSGRDL